MPQQNLFSGDHVIAGHEMEIAFIEASSRGEKKNLPMRVVLPTVKLFLESPQVYQNLRLLTFSLKFLTFQLQPINKHTHIEIKLDYDYLKL